MTSTEIIQTETPSLIWGYVWVDDEGTIWRDDIDLSRDDESDTGNYDSALPVLTAILGIADLIEGWNPDDLMRAEVCKHAGIAIVTSGKTSATAPAALLDLPETDRTQEPRTTNGRRELVNHVSWGGGRAGHHLSIRACWFSPAVREDKAEDAA